jgi:hypothetical protein
MAPAKISLVSPHHGGQGLIGPAGSLQLIGRRFWVLPRHQPDIRSTWAGRRFELYHSIHTKAAGFPQLDEVSANAAHPTDCGILVTADPVGFFARIKCEPPYAFGELGSGSLFVFTGCPLQTASYTFDRPVQSPAFFIGKILQDVLVGHAGLGVHALPADPVGDRKRVDQRAFNVVSRPKVGPIRVRQISERRAVVTEADDHLSSKPMLQRIAPHGVTSGRRSWAGAPLRILSVTCGLPVTGHGNLSAQRNAFRGRFLGVTIRIMTQNSNVAGF